ncbi:hypothetical protein PG984_015381 [Apiospora sp. TS-2023a]
MTVSALGVSPVSADAFSAANWWDAILSTGIKAAADSLKFVDKLRMRLGILGQLIVVLAARRAAEAAQGLDGRPDGEEFVHLAAAVWPVGHHDLDDAHVPDVSNVAVEVGLGAPGQEEAELLRGVERLGHAFEGPVLIERVRPIRIHVHVFFLGLGPELRVGGGVRRLLLALVQGTEPLAEHRHVGLVALPAGARGHGGGALVELLAELGQLRFDSRLEGDLRKGGIPDRGQKYGDLEQGHVLLNAAHQGIVRDFLKGGAHQEVVRDHVAYQQLGDSVLVEPVALLAGLCEVLLLDGCHLACILDEAGNAGDGSCRPQDVGLPRRGAMGNYFFVELCVPYPTCQRQS